MANSTDSPDLTENAIVEIGGPFALGQWLAVHDDPTFAERWRPWCSTFETQAADSVALKAEDGKLVFECKGQDSVKPLEIPKEGNDLLEQTYALLTAEQQPVYPLAVAVPQETDEDPGLPGTESEITLPGPAEPAVALAPLPKLETSAMPLPLPGAAESNVVTLPDKVESVIAVAPIPEPETSATPLPLPGVAESNVVTLPDKVESVIAAAPLPEPATSATPLPLPGAAESNVVTLPDKVESVIAAAPLPEPATSATTLPLPGAAESKVVMLPDKVEPAVAAAPIPKLETSATPLPLPDAAESKIVTLPDRVEPAVAAALIPEPATSATTLPPAGGAAEFVAAGQYLLPLELFPAGETGGKTLAKVIEGLGAELPQAASEILGELTVRKGFLVLGSQFKGLVLEVQLDQPIRALVRLSMAYVENKWVFGGEAYFARADKDGTPQPPLIFILKFAADSTSKSLVMALEGDVDLIDDLFRPMFGDFSIPDGISLSVSNPALVLVNEKIGTNGDSITKALVSVSVKTGVDFGDLPFVGEPIKAQGAARMSLDFQYASKPFPSSEIDEINSVLGGDWQIAKPDGADLDGLQLAVALQLTTGKPLQLSVPLSGGQTAPPPIGGDQSRSPVAAPKTPDADQTIQWLKVNRAVGPAYLDKVGVGFKDGAVQFRVSARVQLSALNFFVEGLGGGLKLTWPLEPTFNLDGLGIGFEVPPISISGALIRSTINNVDSYDGMAVIKAASFTITGLGSYSKVGGDPSLFIFAVLHKDLGGPSFFHVTGLAAGFGFNRALKLPPIEEVQNFPLVRGSLEDNYFGGSGTAGAMEKLRDYIPPSGGDYWFAAGIRFNSFEMIQSFALLSISFGHEVEIGLLGLSKMSLPKGAEPGSAIAYAELALRAVIKPEEGSIAVEGRLTDNSYIFSQSCRLTGGFAFYTWFSGPHSGDFVITLGGYHPKFVRPAHYPIVPRLGVNWQVSSQLTVIAEFYFALTPSCLMAGGKMSAVYKAGAIKAWFCAYADFLLSWQPFYYLIDMGIRIGVEADLGLFSISVHLSVDLHIWGPEFAGEIDVDLSVVSFTVRFGPDKAPPAPLNASEFATAFLPPAKPEVSAKTVLRATRTLRAKRDLRATPPPVKSDVLATQINSGLLRQEIGENKEPLRVVNGHAFALSVQSMVPVTRFNGLAPAQINASIKALDLLGVRPMGKTNLDSEFLVGIRNNLDRANGGIKSDRENLRVSLIENGVPEALWGKAEKEGEVPPVAPEAKTITVTLGMRISFAPIPPKGALPAMEIEKFKYETFNKPIPWDPTVKPAATFSAEEIIGESIDTVMSGKTVNQRNAVLAVLARQSPFNLNKVDLSELVKHRESYFQADPMVGRLGSLNESIV